MNMSFPSENTSWPITLIIIAGSFIWISSCNPDKNKNQQHFLEKKPQEQNQREVRTQIEPEKEYKLADFEVFSARHLSILDNRLFILAGEPHSVLSLNLNDFKDRYWIGPDKGRGPGELTGISSHDIRNNQIAFSNEQLSKILIYTLEGDVTSEFTTEYGPHRVGLLPGNQILGMAPTSQDHLFQRYNYEGDIIGTFGRPNPDRRGFLQYDGNLHIDNAGNIYFTGLPEPILKKYSPEGDLIFSRATIDNWDTRGNYAESVDGETRIMGYSPAVIYSTYGFTVYDDYMIVRPVDNDMEELQHIVDIYDSSDGSYQYSVEFSDTEPIRLAATDQHIYTTENHGGEHFLLVYPNFLNRTEPPERN